VQGNAGSLAEAWARLGISRITTPHGIRAVVSALSAMHRGEYAVKSVQAYHAQIERPVKKPVGVRS
jgi:hypothetical protein